ncbi:hypothetical protein KAFR_0C06470 [Kazachstania africana CBS 2517]|uniref:Glycoside hydrolase family 17 protein n=1 Tax=Kazachstania africana (strain ATCC 22294 / BCRC 22015 / CBS 2517 / CECT 1963 / NBRC 1671 / NRRL Y-8276) TaxID=1071382 RepID=H2ATE3_KAZAF|nr:hypothetical protein KAFR_0C06470 [Kazachstania africana CBS 2517]CCF57643.1 hypothetical protein KAFR_0C06470 [Kazachstania africana CBS 2517]
MRLENLLTTASLLGAAVAAPANHEHKEKRDVAVVTSTVTAHNTVVVYATTVVGASDKQETQAAAAPEAAAVTTAEASATAVETDNAATSSTEEVATSSSSAATDSSSDSAVKGITYSPYNADGTCKSTSEVADDFAELTAYPNIRLYGVDCDQVANVLQAKSDDQKLFLGVYYMNAIESGVQTIADAIASYGSWDDVVTVSIGNELVNGGEATTDQVESYIETGRTALTAAGYTGPVVSVETFTAVLNNPVLCDYSDYMAVNAHAYFDYNTVAEDAGSWLLNQIERVWSACDGSKKVVITESGWPSQGETYGVAVPSKANQKAAIAAITESCGDDTYLFTAFNDLWKADGSYGVEKWFGILSDE